MCLFGILVVADADVVEHLLAKPHICQSFYRDVNILHDFFGHVFPDGHYLLPGHGCTLSAFVAKAVVQAYHGGELPVVGIVALRVEAVVDGVGIHLERQTEGLPLVGLYSQSGAQIVAQPVTAPSQWHALWRHAECRQLIVVPSIAKSHATQHNQVQRTVLVSAKEVRQVNHQVHAGGDVLPLIVLAEVFESALGLRGAQVQTGTHYRGEIVAQRESGAWRGQLVHRGICCGELQPRLRLGKRMRSPSLSLQGGGRAQEQQDNGQKSVFFHCGAIFLHFKCFVSAKRE